MFSKGEHSNVLCRTAKAWFTIQRKDDATQGRIVEMQK